MLYFEKNYSGSSFKGQNLKGHIFYRCNLEETDFSESTGLSSSSFPQSNLTGSTLPSHVEFSDSLSAISDSSKQARVAFLFILSFSFYCLLTISKTNHETLIDNSATAELPIIDEKVPLAPFYAISPIIFLLISIWMHIYIQRSINIISTLPSYFPSGEYLGVKINQWIPIISKYDSTFMQNRKLSSTQFYNIEYALSYIALWLASPFTILLIYAATIPMHNVPLSIFISLIFSMSVSIYFLSHNFIGQTFQRNPILSEDSASDRRRISRSIFIPLILMIPVSVDSTYGYWPNSQTRIAFAKIGDITFGVSDLFGMLPGASSDIELPYGAELVAMPKGWKLEQNSSKFRRLLTEVPTENRTRRNFDRAIMNAVFFPKADFRYSKMRQLRAGEAIFVEAKFNNAQLRGAKFIDSDLRGADFSNSDLRDADFRNADLRGACLDGALLEGAMFDKADLSGATVRPEDWEDFLPSVNIALEDAICKKTRFPVGFHHPCLKNETKRSKKSPSIKIDGEELCLHSK